MDWIWDHLQLILVAAGAIAVWLNQRRKEQSGEPADYDEDGIPDNRTPPRVETRELPPLSRDGGGSEHAERVREEIRRKIAERRGRSAPSQPPPPAPAMEPFNPFRPVFREEPVPPPVPVQRPVPTPVSPTREVATAYDDEAALDRQRRMAEQLAELESRRRETRRMAQALAETGATPVSARETARASAEAPAGVGARGLAADLGDPKALRRAMVLREVLDAPVALRGA